MNKGIFVKMIFDDGREVEVYPFGISNLDTDMRTSMPSVDPLSYHVPPETLYTAYLDFKGDGLLMGESVKHHLFIDRKTMADTLFEKVIELDQSKPIPVMRIGVDDEYVELYNVWFRASAGEGIMVIKSFDGWDRKRMSIER